MRTSNIIRTLAVAGAVFAAADLSRAEERRQLFLRSHERFLELFQPVVSDAAKATVRVLADSDEVSLGTVVDSDGWIVTKASQLNGNSYPDVRLANGRTVPSRVVGVDEEFDIALVKVSRTGLDAVKFTDTKDALVGNWVASPDQDGRPVAVGVISVPTRKLSSLELRASRNARRGGFLGIQMETIRDTGVRITKVLDNTGAKRAGLKIGDVIIGLGDKEIRDQNELGELLRGRQPGEKIQLKIVRDDEEQSLEAKLGKRPELNRSDYQNNLGSQLSERRNGFPTILQHDTVIPPTDCGGPLVDLDGRIFGVNIARAGRTESYAVPGEIVTKIVEKLRAEVSTDD